MYNNLQRVSLAVTTTGPHYFTSALITVQVHSFSQLILPSSGEKEYYSMMTSGKRKWVLHQRHNIAFATKFRKK